MRSTKIVRVLAVVALALLLAGPAVAQDKAVVIAGGWAPAYGWAEGTSEFIPLGLFVNGSFPVASNVSILGDVGWQRKSGVDIVEATGGVRYWVPMQGKAMPFVEGSAGLGYGSITGGSSTGFAFSFGGGVDVPVPNKNVGVRFQVNYYRFQISGVGINAIRFGIGISGKMGGK